MSDGAMHRPEAAPAPRAGTLWLVPTPIAGTAAAAVLPEATLAVLRRVTYFLAEDARGARAFLKAAAHPQPISSLDVVEIGHAPDPNRLDPWLAPLLQDGRDGALVSEAGCPGVADPGAELVARAHTAGIRVRPLAGPSAILLALMASGLDGQRFRFVGYLPREPGALAGAIHALERASAMRAETQLFIETPYRNERLFDALLAACAPDSRLHLAVGLTGDDEYTRTLTIARWRTLPPGQRPELRRRPCVFALLAAPRARDGGARPGSVRRTEVP